MRLYFAETGAPPPNPSRIRPKTTDLLRKMNVNPDHPPGPPGRGGTKENIKAVLGYSCINDSAVQ